MFRKNDRALQCIQHYIARVCATILDYLYSTTDTGDNQRNPFQWQGPSRTDRAKNEAKFGISTVFPHNSVLPLVLIGLQATVRYIKTTDLDTLMEWFPGSRHGVAHNGRFLDALYQTPTKPRPRNAGEPSAEQTYSATKRDVKEKRKQFKDEASGVVGFACLEDAVDSVIRELTVKNVGPILDECRDEIIQQLRRI